MGGPIDIAQRRWQWVIHDHDHDHLVIKVRCMDLPDSDWGDFNCLRAVDSSSLIYHNFTCPGANFTYPAKFWVARADWSPIIFNSSPGPPNAAFMSQVSIGSDNGLSPFSAPSHCLNQCWIIVNWTLRNKLQWNLNQNTKLFIHKNASENVGCEMAAILSRGRWVKHCITYHLTMVTYYLIVGKLAVSPSWWPPQGEVKW